MISQAAVVFLFAILSAVAVLARPGLSVIALLAAVELAWVGISGLAVLAVAATQGPAYITVAVVAVILGAAELAVTLALFWIIWNEGAANVAVPCRTRRP